VIDCSGLYEVVLQFNHDVSLMWIGFEHTVSIRSSATGGEWVEIDKFTSATSGLETYDISAYAAQQSDVQINFHYDDLNNWEFWWIVDNVRVYSPPSTTVLPIDYLYGDNGKYEVDFQIIDDDMWWDLSGAQPVFMGTGDPNDWISHTIFEVEVLNTDPVISPDVKAYAELDLRLRVSGTKDTDATMILYETIGDETTVAGTASVTRDPGSPDIGIMPSVDLMMTKEYEYELVVEVTGGSGGNPTWIFDMVFPDGKFKEFKHTFNDENGWTWVISNSELKAALLGHDIIFEATAEDSGSDDLAFVWNFGDCTPHGIHLYANCLYTPPLPLDPINGESDEAEVMFTQLGYYADPWFEYDDNDDRSPEANPIVITDTITHIFDEDQPYYYYVTLIVMDDDVNEPYPSTQLHPVSGLDYYHLEIALG
jgi:hypothetical protein